MFSSSTCAPPPNDEDLTLSSSDVERRFSWLRRPAGSPNRGPWRCGPAPRCPSRRPRSGKRLSTSSRRRDPRAARGGAEAEVDAVAEREVVVDRAVDVEAVGVGNLRSSRLADRGEQQRSRCPREPSGRGARRPASRSAPAPATATRSAAAPRSAPGTSERSAASSRRWSGCSASTLPVQPMSRVVVSLPARGEQAHVAEDLVAGELARRAGLVLELGVEQVGHEVVGGVLRAPVDVLAEHRRPPVARRRRRLALRRAAVLRAHARVDPVADRRPGRLRGCRAACRSCASASRAPRSAMKSNPPLPTSGSRRARAELADLRLDRQSSASG